jgi:tetratricopeptide (TPR) repeat protein
MQVESVSYIASYGFLSFFFGISALILSSVQKLNKNFIPIVILLLILSILTKETGIVFLALIPTLKFLTKRNSVITYSIISSAIFCAYLILRFFIVGLFSNSMISVPISLLSLPMRLLNIPAILFYYLKTFLFPLNLAISQMWTISSINLNNFYLPLFLDLLLFFIFILLGFICYKHKKTFPTFLFFGVWFILGISLYLQVIPLDMTVSEQWFYLPMAGLLGLIGIAWQVIFSKYIKTNIALAFLIIISILLSFRTMARIPEWQNPIKLYSHDVNVIDSYNTESLLGNEYWYQNKTAEALTHFKKSDELRPGYDYIASEIATSYERLGDLKNAKDYHLKSMSYKSYRTDVRHTYITYLNASRFFLYFDDPRITIKYSSQGVKEYPTEKYLWILLGLAENKLGNKPAAISALNKAYKAFPDPNVLYLASQISAGKQIEVPIQAFWPRDN